MDAEACSSPSHHVLVTNQRRQPPNTAAVGIFLDSEHVGDVPTIIQHTKNEDACRLLASWRRQVLRFQFIVLAGRLDCRDGGLVGGLAEDWPGALYMYAFVGTRLDSIAAQQAPFLSAWVMRLTDERRDAVLETLAVTQAVGGRA